MGKSLPSATKLQEFAKFVSPGRFQTPKRAKTISQIRVSAPESGKPGAVRLESERVKQQKLMESSEGQQSESRMPLGQVVSDCVKRWFQDALKEAKAGDSGMQVLVGQMYYSGYGVPRDPQKVNLFFPSFLFLVFSFFFFLVFFFFFPCFLISIVIFS
jgi:TPR repeat protein